MAKMYKVLSPNAGFDGKKPIFRLEGQHMFSHDPMVKTKPIFIFIGAAVYAILFILVALFVFVANDERQPINEIFQWGYLPVTIYSAFSLWVSFGLFLLLKKVLNGITSFACSLIIGIPVGLILLNKMIQLLMA